MPKPIEHVIPVFMPTETGISEVELAHARLKSGTLVMEFRNNAPGIAIQRLIDRGVLLGLSFVLAEPSEEPTQEEKDERDLELLKSDDNLTGDDIL